MTPYFFLITIPIIFSFMPINKNISVQKIMLFFTGLVYIFFIGFRHEVGPDWIAYIGKYDYISHGSLNEAIAYTEPGYAILNWLMAKLNTDVYGVNFLAASLLMFGLVEFAKKMPLPWLALISATPYLIIAVACGLTRQSAAIGIAFYLLAGWGKNSTSKNIILALLATSFHYSAFITLLFVLQAIKMPAWCRWIIILAGGAMSFVIFSQTDQYTVYKQRYVVANIESFGALQHISLNAIPAMIYLVFIKKWRNIYGKNNLMELLSYLSLLSIAGLLFSSTAVDRLSLYLSPIQMLVYSTIPIVFKNKIYSLIIVIIHVFILFLWLNYSSHAFTFLPYQNILF